MLNKLKRLILGPSYDPNLSSYTNCLNFTKYEEGGYSGDSRDAGNWTSGKVGIGRLIGSKYGVSAPVIVKKLGYIPSSDFVKNINQEFFESIADSYWIGSGANALPKGADLMVFDFGWNRGIHESLIILQTIVGSTPDGVYGADTLKCAKSFIETNGLLHTINALADCQISNYTTLDDFSIYGKGWVDRTKARQKFSLTMASM